MSYDAVSGIVERLTFSVNPSGIIELTFTCPRCGNENYHQIKPVDLIYGFEVECSHWSCVGPGERFGYQLSFQPAWSSLILGENDRPLHKKRA